MHPVPRLVDRQSRRPPITQTANHALYASSLPRSKVLAVNVSHNACVSATLTAAFEVYTYFVTCSQGRC